GPLAGRRLARLDPLRRAVDGLEAVDVDDVLPGLAQERRRAHRAAGAVVRVAEITVAVDGAALVVGRGALPIDRVRRALAVVRRLRIVRGLRGDLSSHAARGVHDEQDVRARRGRGPGRLTDVDLGIVGHGRYCRDDAERRCAEGDDGREAVTHAGVLD